VISYPGPVNQDSMVPICLLQYLGYWLLLWYNTQRRRISVWVHIQCEFDLIDSLAIWRKQHNKRLTVHACFQVMMCYTAMHFVLYGRLSAISGFLSAITCVRSLRHQIKRQPFIDVRDPSGIQLKPFSPNCGYTPSVPSIKSHLHIPQGPI
jgi:hypothetical protein